MGTSVYGLATMKFYSFIFSNWSELWCITGCKLGIQYILNGKTPYLEAIWHNQSIGRWKESGYPHGHSTQTPHSHEPKLRIKLQVISLYIFQ